MFGLRSAKLRTAIAAAGIAILAVASTRFLHQPFYGYIWQMPFSGWSEIFPITAPAALRVWTFWALATAIIGGWLLRFDPALGLFDAIFGGATGVWMFAYVAGNLLGPIGLFRGVTIWIIALAAAALLIRKPPHLNVHPPSAGLKLALLACALVAIGVLPMQLGSPIPPYMDILNNPASAQRIVTFHRYVPWDNDPYGHWGPAIQTPGLELFYAMLAMGSGMRLAVLAETAATLPMMSLIVLATWRLGRTLAGGSAGALAAMLLFATTIFMRGVQMRGTALAFVMVAGGLGFMLDRDRRPLRTAWGAMMLGCAFASHAIDGAMGLATAAVAITVASIDGDFANPAREALCLVGALMLAIPEFAVALMVRPTYPILPACQLAGLGVIALAASGVTRRAEARAAARWLQRALIAATFGIIVFFPSDIINGLRGGFPLLTWLCVGGLLMAATIDYSHSGGIWMAAIALAIADVMQYFVAAAIHVFQNQQAQFGLSDVVFKLQEYWSPYFLVFPAAILFDWSYRKWSRPLTVAALLALLVFPWSEHPERDINYTEHPLADQWAVNWQSGKAGWWQNSPDHRWIQSRDEFALLDKLRDEIEAGRITAATHVVHVAPDAVIWRDELLYSLYLGIDDDLYLINPGGDLNSGPSAGSRMRPATRFAEALASKPPYIVIYKQAPPGFALPPRGYAEIFRQDGIRLFRREAISDAEGSR